MWRRCSRGTRPPCSRLWAFAGTPRRRELDRRAVHARTFEPGRRVLSLALARRVAEVAPLRQILVNRNAVAEPVEDGRVDLIETQRRIGHHDLLGPASLAEMLLQRSFDPNP